MAQIYTMPLRIDSEGAARLAAMLGEALASGDDLGPRGPHIRALGISLEGHCDQLQRVVESFDMISSKHSFDEISSAQVQSIRLLQATLSAVVKACLPLARLAQAH